MITIERTNSENPDFIKLVKLLDADLAFRDGDLHSFFNQFNKIDTIKYAVVASINGIAVGAGALRKYQSNVGEIKRMYVLEEYRGHGVATLVLAALEIWARELNFEKCILETGQKYPEAIQLYKKNGYKVIANYGPYITIADSVCFEKYLR